jgi:hypothetical protein
VREHHEAAVLLLIADERGGFLDAEHRYSREGDRGVIETWPSNSQRCRGR